MSAEFFRYPAVVFAAALSFSALADGTYGGLTVTGGDVTYSSGQIRLTKKNAVYMITGIADAGTYIYTATSCTLYLKGVRIVEQGNADATSASDLHPAIQLGGSDSATVFVHFSGKNYLKGSPGYAGLEVNHDNFAKAYIIGDDSTAELIAVGGSKAAGIGGRQKHSHAPIAISGQGVIRAYGGGSEGASGIEGAGIGSGCWGEGADIAGSKPGKGGKIAITGCTVYAKGGEHGAGIGGGAMSDGGTVEISGTA